MTPARSIRKLLIALLALGTLWTGAWARAAAPRDELLRLIPEDIAFCLVIQDLRGHADTFLASPFFEQLRQSPLGRAAHKAPEAQRLAEAVAVFQETLGTDLAHLRNDILGDAVVLTYRPGPPEAPHREQGLFLLWARDPRLLAEIIDRLNESQKTSGLLKELEPRSYRGTSYVCRVEENASGFYYLHGPLLAFSFQEETIRHVIDAEGQQPAAEHLAARQLRQLGADRSLAALWINARSFDVAVAKEAASTDKPDAALQQAICAYWKALQGAALWFSVGKTEAELSVGLLTAEDRLPVAAQRRATDNGQPSELWRRFPENAIFTLAGRFDLDSWNELVGPFLSQDAAQKKRDDSDHSPASAIGRSVFKEVLPSLGPDWGLCIAPAPTAAKAWFPHVLWALRVRSVEGKPPIDAALFQALHACAIFAVWSYNSSHDDHLTLQTETQDRHEVHYLVNDAFPPGFRPAYAIKDGYLLLTSSPEAVRSFTSPRPPSQGNELSEAPLLRLSFSELRRYLENRRAAFTAHIAETSHIPREEIDRSLDKILQVLDLARGMEISQRSTPGQLTISLRIRTEQALGK